jgi:hypothetical protein
MRRTRRISATICSGCGKTEGSSSIDNVRSTVFVIARAL